MTTPSLSSQRTPSISPSLRVSHDESTARIDAGVASIEPISESISTRPAPTRGLSHPLFATKARGIRIKIMRFTPSWFSVTMGTGVINSLLFNLPFESFHPGFRGIGSVFLVLDMFLFLTFSIITILRYALYPRFFTTMLDNEAHSLFLGTIPMGLVTIASGIARTGTEYGITRALDAGIALWWIAGVMSVYTAFFVPYIMFTRHNHSTENLTAAWLLPIVPPITIAAVGSSLCQLLIARNQFDYALVILLVSYVMLGVGLLLASALMVIYFQRLTIHHLPPREVIISTFLPLGPCGQGGFALIELGRVSMKLFPLLAAAYPERSGIQDLAAVGGSFYGAGIVTGLLLFGLGVFWMFIAIVSVGSHFIGRTLMFNMGWWSTTFPLGSMTLLVFSLGTSFDSAFFNILASIMTFSVTLFWLIVFIPTVMGFFAGTLFVAPCLVKLPDDVVEKFAKINE